MRLAIATLSAIALPTLIMTCWYLYGQFETFDANDPYIWVRTKGFFFMVLAITAGFVVVLGLPAYFLLKHIKRVTWWSTVVSGFLIAATPVAIFLWPYGSPGSSASSNGVDTMISGVPTLAGWLEYLQAVLFFGVFGLASAFVFWLLSPNKQINVD
jgi:hypothetical protein